MLHNRMMQLRGKTGFSALILINIQRFKAINDSLGATYGDEVLIEFSNRLAACYRGGERQSWYSSDRPCLEQHTIARLDGDRFAVHMPMLSGHRWDDTFADTSQRLKDLLDTPVFIANQSIYLSADIGIAMLGNDTMSVESLINDAETAMKYARQATSTNYAIYSSEMGAKARELLSLENGLRTAVENGEIFLVFQPKVDVRSGRINGAEALVRWMHPEFGLISPVNFIPLAENSGMIVSIGEWVLRTACQVAHYWQSLGFDDFKIAVNVSVRQLHEKHFVEKVRLAL